VANLPAGAYATITEPRVLVVSTRIAPADGATQVVVTVDPSLVGATAVTIDRDGAGTWSGPATQAPDGTWTRSLVAPAQPGSARIRVALDNVPLLVRPRVRFGG
jgi:hypothetical protein